MNEKKFEAGSIRQTYFRLKEEGYYISEKMLRDLIKKKEIPAGYVGKRPLSFIPALFTTSKPWRLKIQIII